MRKFYKIIIYNELKNITVNNFAWLISLFLYRLYVFNIIKKQHMVFFLQDFYFSGLSYA